METAEIIDNGLKSLRTRLPAYVKYRRYYEGEHSLAFATEKFRTAFSSLFRAFADNLCPAVIDSVADRLTLIGFDPEKGGEDLTKAAWDLWLENRMDRRAGEVHQEALRSGDAYLIVWPGVDDAPVLYPNRGDQVSVHYDPEQPGRVDWALKLWAQDDERARLNVYWPDRIEKYVSRQKADGSTDLKFSSFEPYEAPGEAWPLPNPWETVPVFHFGNNASVGAFGRSELRDVIPLQDALNKALADMLVAMEYVALPQRWATGLEVEIDETTGKPKAPFTPGAERVWAVGDETVKFGQFDPADLTQFLNVQAQFRAEIARVSGTPLHYLMVQTGDWPSGEAMKTAESRFLAKVLDRQIAFGNVWEDAMTLALRMAGEGEGKLSALWKDPTPRVEKDQAEIALLKKQIGVSEEQLLREAGYSPEQIEEMQKEKEARLAEMGDAMLSAFESGAEDGLPAQRPGSRSRQNGMPARAEG